MTERKVAIAPEFNVASKEARIAFVQGLWDRIAENESQVPFPDNHKKMLDERLNAHRANPRSSRPWNEVREEILTKLRDG